MSKKESYVQKTCIEFLKKEKVYFRRINTTGIPKVKDGKLFLIPNPGEEGTADVVVHMPSHQEGLSTTIYVEFKRTQGGKQSDAQKMFEYRVTRAGCLYWLVDNVELFMEKFKNVRNLRL